MAAKGTAMAATKFVDFPEKLLSVYQKTKFISKLVAMGLNVLVAKGTALVVHSKK